MGGRIVAPMTTKFGPVGDEVGTMVRFGDAFTARTLLDAAGTGARLSVVEHLLAVRELGAPLHMHSREDEFTIITKGRVGFLLGDEIFYAGPGELVLKPRDQWHTFWNAGSEQARMLEIISPAGFEKYFEEIEPFFPEEAPPDLEAMAVVNAKYGLQMDFESLPQLIDRFGLTPPLEMGAPPPA